MDIKLTKITGHETKGKVGSINVKKDDSIKVGDTLLTIESSKASVEVESEYEGTINEVLIEEGQEISIGTVMFKIDGKKQEKKAAYKFGLAVAKKEKLEVDLLVIGAGPGGYAAAIKASKEGLKTAIIEKEELGGTCLNHGCIPTKSFVKSANMYNDIINSELYGIKTENTSISISTIVNRKNNIVNTLKSGIEYLLKTNNVKLVKGEANIESLDCIKVKNDKVDIEINPKYLMLAMGSEAVKLNIPGTNLEGVLTSKEILNIETLPKTLTIIGGGVIGMEFAFIFASLGSKVTIIEYMDEILTALDDDILQEIKKCCEEKGIDVYTNAKAEEIIKDENGNLITKFKQQNNEKYVTSEKVLMSVGRRANIQNQDWDKLKIKLTERKNAIQVNDKMETSVKNVYAIGDVNGKVQLAHVATHQGMVAVDNMVNKESIMYYDNIPSVVFTMPEIAMTGMSETMAKKNNIPIKIGKIPFSSNGKALTEGKGKGFAKIIIDKNSNQVLGGAVIGPHASDIIAVITNLVEIKANVEEAAETIYAHPTTSEVIHESLLDTMGKAIHV